MELDGWHNCPEVAVDGVNGAGKSELTKMLRRKYLKINDYMPVVTNGSEYNYNVFKAMQYLIWQQEVKATNAVWDRCAYSNLIFHFAHHLMAHYKDAAIPSDHNVILPIFNQMAIDTCLMTSINEMKRIRNVPTLFIVCRNINIIGLSLCHRNTLNDIYNSKEFNYQMAQYHAYVYFGKILQYPVIDLMDFHEAGMTLGDMQTAIARKIDVRSPVVDSLIAIPDDVAARNFQRQLCQLSGNNLLFTCSKK